VRDLQGNTTTLASRTASVGAKGNGDSMKPSLSAGGRFVAFGSFASNLHPDDGDTILDVFVRDLQAGTTTLASRTAGAAGAKGNGGSNTPSISPDGRFVAFESDASNLDPGDGDTTRDVFLRDVLGPPPAPAPTPSPIPSPTPTPTPTATIDAIPPVLSQLSLTPTRFRVDSAPTRDAARRGTRVSYRLSEVARVELTVERALPGRRKRVRGKARCVRPTGTLVRRKAKRCTRHKPAGRLTRNGTAGNNGFRFTGRIGTRPLRPGRYRLRATATDPAGNSSRPSTRRFRIVRR
jgi:hypothetical protein